MSKQPLFAAYLLIGLGLYFLMTEFKQAFPLFDNLSSWPTVLIVIGIAFILHSNSSRESHFLFSGLFMLLLGIHFHGNIHYEFWIDHFSIYFLIIGVALLILHIKTKQGLVQGIIFTVLGIIFLLPAYTQDQVGKVVTFPQSIDQ